jgi:hypothetical protein
LSNWKKFLKHISKQETIKGIWQAVINEGFGFSASLRPSTWPKNARDLTLQPFVGIMDSDQSSCFMLSGGIINRGVQLEFGNLWDPQEQRLMVFPRFFSD